MKNTKFSKILKELYKLVGSKLPKEFVSKVLAKPKKLQKVRFLTSIVYPGPYL